MKRYSLVLIVVQSNLIGLFQRDFQQSFRKLRMGFHFLYTVLLRVHQRVFEERWKVCTMTRWTHPPAQPYHKKIQSNISISRPFNASKQSRSPIAPIEIPTNYVKIDRCPGYFKLINPLKPPQHISNQRCTGQSERKNKKYTPIALARSQTS